jgi:DNA-binding MarR family transcriptional regulator
MDHSVDFNKISSYSGPEESPGYLLWRVSTAWRRAIESVLKPLGLTHPQFVILASLAWLTRGGQSPSQVEISRQAGLDPNTTSQILRGLQAKKLIERKHRVDERSKSPTLTTRGAQVLADAMPAVESADAAFFSPLDLKKSGIIGALQTLSL